ncbi:MULTISPECIES: DUF4259 domain-containing protein [unclassified Microbulbifer]|uniref:DUF4259 domain-containing protein n=1 Tax=unclassified Microbulbifer TaxID=2619833 RepID=UPI0027E40B25|nr:MULTISPECIES: DUF4259 domain-containing protein [unclassified Microbulbifer]
MGTWNPGSFENDAAADAVEYLLECDGYRLIEVWVKECLDAYENDDTISVDLCSSVIVGAEVVAALENRSAADMPRKLAKWIKKYQPKDQLRLKQKVNFALFFATEHSKSELKQLWKEKGDMPWRAAVNELKIRTEYIKSGIESGWLKLNEDGKPVLKMQIKK